MDQPAPKRPKLAETVIEPTVKLREATIGRCCEVLGDTAIEHTELGDYSYLGPGCMVADAEIGRFCANRCASPHRCAKPSARPAVAASGYLLSRVLHGRRAARPHLLPATTR